MADVKFLSTDAVKAPVPKGLKIAYRTLMAVLFIWTAAKLQFPEIPKPTADIVTRILDFGTPLFYGLCQLFGISKPE